MKKDIEKLKFLGKILTTKPKLTALWSSAARKDDMLWERWMGRIQDLWALVPFDEVFHVYDKEISSKWSKFLTTKKSHFKKLTDRIGSFLERLLHKWPEHREGVRRLCACCLLVRIPAQHGQERLCFVEGKRALYQHRPQRPSVAIARWTICRNKPVLAEER